MECDYSRPWISMCSTRRNSAQVGSHYIILRLCGGWIHPFRTPVRTTMGLEYPWILVSRAEQVPVTPVPRDDCIFLYLLLSHKDRKCVVSLKCQAQSLRHKNSSINTWVPEFTWIKTGYRISTKYFTTVLCLLL